MAAHATPCRNCVYDAIICKPLTTYVCREANPHPLWEGGHKISCRDPTPPNHPNQPPLRRKCILSKLTMSEI